MSNESHKYYYGNLYVNITKYVKNQQLFMDLHVGIAMDVKNQQLFMRPICGYCNGCKTLTTISEIYMWVLHIWHGLMKIRIKRV